MKVLHVMTKQGRPQDLAGGGPKFFFFRFLNLHVAGRHAAHGEAMRFVREVRGHAPPPEIFCLQKFSKITIFYIKFLKLQFLYKRINILDTRLLWGNNCSREKIS